MVSCSKCCGKNESSEEEGPLIPVRFIQFFMLFLGNAITYAVRNTWSISIVAMTNRNETKANVDVFDWDEKVTSYVLSSFFWGYLITLMPGGYFAHRFGPKWPIFVALFGCSLLSFLSPLGAKIGDWYLVVAVRSLQGLFQGVIFPSVHQFIANWAPVDERARVVGCIYAGNHLGTVFALTAGGYMAATPIGWPSNFYLVGGIGIGWSICWFIFGVSSPSDHKTITASEREYIFLGNEKKTAKAEPSPELPCSKILTSVAFYAAIVSFGSNSFGFWMFLAKLPAYVKNILNFTMGKTGILSAAPYIVHILVVATLIYINGVITSRKWMTINTSRKFFNTFGQWIPMFCLIIMGFLTSGEHKDWVILLYIIAISMNAAYLFGSYVNPIDLAPNFAGPLMGVCNFFANVVSMASPLVAGVVVTDEKNPALWRTLFFIAAAFYFVGSLTFIIFGKTNVQPWNEPEQTESKN